MNETDYYSMTYEQIAKRLNLTVWRVRQLAAELDLPRAMSGRRRFFRHEDLQAMRARNKRPGPSKSNGGAK